MKTAFKILFVFVFALVTSSLIYLYVYRQNPVLFRYVDRASVSHSAFIVQNPLRDRGSENEAEIILSILKSGDCQKALSKAKLDEEKIIYLCEREGYYKLQSWSLMDREDEDSKTTLVYNVNRYDQNDRLPDHEYFSGLVWIEVENMNGVWKTIDFYTYY